MLKKISVFGVLAFSLLMLGNQVNAQYNAMGTNGYNTTGTNGYNTTGTNGYNNTGTNGVNSYNQGNYNNGYGARTTAVDNTPRNNWGWLGLLGLAGLAGLRGRNKNNDPERQR